MHQKILTVLLTCSLTLSLLGCGKDTPAEAGPALVPTTETVTLETALPEATVAESSTDISSQAPELAAFEAVLSGERGFYLNGSGELLYISEISKAFSTEEMPWTVEQLAVLDFHGDGTVEVVLEISNDIGFVILGYKEDGNVCGQAIWHRALQNLKADGTYMGSGSSFDHSYYQQTPSEEIILAECYENMDGTLHYQVNGEETDAETFAAFEEAQGRKDNAVWYPSWEDFLQSTQGL